MTIPSQNALSGRSRRSPNRGAAQLPAVLVVDDVPDNLLALEAALQRDDVEVLTASSGREALELLLERDVAVAIIDVMMPEMDGFELAELIRGVERTRRVPIIFVTAGSRAEYRVFTGYETGAIDFLYKPLDERVLRAKVDVLVSLEKQRRAVDLALDAAEHARAETQILLRLARATSQRQAPDDVYVAALDAVRELFETERSAILVADEAGRMRFRAWRGLSEPYRNAVDGHSPWSASEADPLPLLIADVTLDPSMAAYRAVFESERIRAVAFVPLVVQRKLLGKFMLYWDRPRAFSEHDRALALAIASQIAEALEQARLGEAERRMHEEERAARTRMAFLAEAGVELSESLDYYATLRTLAELAVPRLADWCAVDIATGDPGETERVAVVHTDPAKVELALALHRRYPPDPRATQGVPHVLATGRSELYPVITDELLASATHDPEHLRIAREIGMRSAIVVPITARGVTHGVITFVSAESGRRYGEPDLEMAEELGRRAGVAIENARSYQALRLAEERLHVALTAGRMGIWEWSIPDGRVSWSPALEAIHGLDPGTFPGTFEAFQNDVHPDDRAELLRSIRSSLESQLNHHVEYRIVLPDGRVRWVAGHGNVVSSRGTQPLSMMGVCMDITERRQLESTREAAMAELEQTLRYNEIFAGVLAHDLRVPLTAILGSAELMLRRLDDQSDRAVKPLRRILSSGGRMTRMINDLLDFARARVGGGFELAPREVDLEKICNQAIAELELAHPDWSMKLASRGASVGFWDVDRLLQVVSNLVTNAGQHGVPGAEILVELDGTDPDRVVLSVHNQGCISGPALATLFSPFGRTSDHTSGGLGLGTYIAQEIVRSHGGIIEVSSSEAEGTTFTVRVPRRTPPHAAES